ncbi:MAG: hypothetical protein WCK10_00925 [Candidatus Staskawiczbacteria bacterium]
MKINLLLIFLCLVVIIFSPLNVRAVIMEVSVTVNSFTVPERSLIDFEIDRPETEYRTSSGRISVVDKNNNFIITNDFTGVGSYIYNGATANASFPYETYGAPYNVYIEMRVTKYPGTICKANCVESIADAGWYMTPTFSYLNRNESWTSSSCGGSAFVANTCGSNIAVSPTFIIPEYYEGSNIIGNYYFRFPAIYTIN